MEAFAFRSSMCRNKLHTKANHHIGQTFKAASPFSIFPFHSAANPPFGGMLPLVSYALLFGLSAVLPLSATRFRVTDDEYTTGPDKAFLKVLSNTETGERASICFSHGGGVETLWLQTKRGRLRQVLTERKRNATAVRANPTWGGRMLIPYANRIRGAKYSFNGTEFRLPINDVAGLNNSLHGLLWNRSLAVLGARAGERSASALLGYTFDPAAPGNAGYPFPLRVEIRYTLSAAGLHVAVNATNLDPSGWPLPFFNGWHPYFLASPLAKSKVVLDPCTPWRHVDVHRGRQYPPPRFSDMVPSTHTRAWRRDNGTDVVGADPANASLPVYMDDEVKAALECAHGYRTRLLTPDGDVTTLATDPHYRYLQIYTGSKSSGGEDAVVLEPLSAMSDAYNNHDGLHVISAGQSFLSAFSVSVE